MATTKKTTTTKAASAEPAKAKKDTSKKAAAPKETPADPPAAAQPAGPSRAELDQALARASAAEVKAADAEKKAADAEKKAADAEKRVAEVDKRHRDAAHAAEKRASDAEKRAHDADKAAKDAAHRAEEITERLHTAKREFEAANAVIADLRGTAGANAARAEGLQAEIVKLRDELSGFKMRCPKCGKNMVEEQYEGIAIDRCSGCNGVYFDSGETEQLIQKIAEGQQKPGFWSGLFKRKKADTGVVPRS